MIINMLHIFLQIADIWNTFIGSTLEIVFKGMLIGILASAPMGPVGILIINRTMQKGRRYGLATGAGAALSDFFYALMTGMGMSFMLYFITDEDILFILKLVGSAMLMIFGIWMFRSDPSKGFRPSHNKKKGTLFHNFITGFFLTISNPLIIFLFTAVYALLTFVIPNHWYEMTVGYLSIIGGAMLWWLGLTWLVNRLKANITIRGMKTMNHIIGGIVITVSVIYAIMTFLHMSIY